MQKETLMLLIEGINNLMISFRSLDSSPALLPSIIMLIEGIKNSCFETGNSDLINKIENIEKFLIRRSLKYSENK